MKQPEIKKVICEREHESRTVYVKAIQEAEGEDRTQAWTDKRAYGAATRYWLLVYAMMRGLPYRAVEPKCGKSNNPSPSLLANYASEFLPPSRSGVRIALVDAIQIWLEGGKFVALPSIPEKLETTPPTSGFIANLKRFLGVTV